MSYDLIETSSDDGQPLELYEFGQGVQRWYFTSSEHEIIYQSKTYVPAPIKRSSVNVTDDIFKAALKLTFPRDNELARQFLGFSPELPTTVTIFRGHWEDDDYIVYWKGRVSGAKGSGSTITLECESVFTSIQRPGLRAKYQRMCRHVLYDHKCRVNQKQFEVKAVVQNINGTHLTLTETSRYQAGWFTGGMIKTEDDAVRFVSSHNGSDLIITRPFHDVKPNTTVKLYPGCNHLSDTCLNKFNNLDNYGGFPHIPTRNPFDGSSII
ncbi:phage BR0599 family protein [Endozoicomonas sp. SM1973]|uniref:Phage BR0599 family protein n=1 Tax=Spartinivicinus marinus TaxID=2994442 RepID=A0A853IB94_9GAMM|nr:phage BR0599 family protein [Spartinivicinus marinus]